MTRNAKRPRVPTHTVPVNGTLLLCDMTPGVSIRVHGQVRIGGEHTGQWQLSWRGGQESEPAVRAWFEALSEEQKHRLSNIGNLSSQHQVLAGLLGGDLVELIEQTGGDRLWAAYLGITPVVQITVLDADQTYQVGERVRLWWKDEATYTLLDVKPQTVVVVKDQTTEKNPPKPRRVNLREFALANFSREILDI